MNSKRRFNQKIIIITNEIKLSPLFFNSKTTTTTYIYAVCVCVCCLHPFISGDQKMDLINTYFVLDTSNIDKFGFGVVWYLKMLVCLCCASGIYRFFFFVLFLISSPSLSYCPVEYIPL